MPSIKVIALGYDNEIGNGQMSYSAADRDRFVVWLKQKYGSVDALNTAWATQRWSRRIGDWDQVDLPMAGVRGPMSAISTCAASGRTTRSAR